MKVYKITTNKSTFYVSAKDIATAIDNANEHIEQKTIKGVSLPIIQECQEIGNYVSPNSDMTSSTDNDDKYQLVSWPEIQSLMEEKWFDECILMNDENHLNDIGSSAYFVPVNRFNEFKNKR